MDSLIVGASFHLNSNSQCSQSLYSRPMRQFSGNGQNFENSNAHRLERGEGSCVQRKAENRATMNKACLDKMVQAEADCFRQFEHIPILTSKVNSVTAKRRNWGIRMTQPFRRS